MSVWTPKHVCVHDNQFNECIFLKKKKKKVSAHRGSYTRLTFQNQTGFRLSGSNYLKHQLIENMLPKQLV